MAAAPLSHSADRPRKKKIVICCDGTGNEFGGPNPDPGNKNAGQAANALSVGTGASETQQFVETAATTLNSIGVNAPNLQNTIQAFQRAYVYGGTDIFEQYNGVFTKIDGLLGVEARLVHLPEMSDGAKLLFLRFVKDSGRDIGIFAKDLHAIGTLVGKEIDPLPAKLRSQHILRLPSVT